ncbi:DUF3618 domain-containing protein [Cryobacterium sp. CG_9.6]|uniref:DUF3618 domain-containing protein n=1 Tax=Cryobacterium sp. CG_9.6 TaxID=2760710 RepID=UPI0024751B21|nr:DUF3618 domain-containing protein [Cryobacterium sp. CG_9.6]MDH6235529.1 hypothetical protein [Cryobacterium sp. CG_9.6]
MKTENTPGKPAVNKPGTDLSAATHSQSTAELRAEAMHARAQLASTLDAIELKLNLPKQLRIKKRRFHLSMLRLGDDNPVALAGIALGTALSVGTVVWLGARAVLSKRF